MNIFGRNSPHIYIYALRLTENLTGSEKAIFENILMLNPSEVWINVRHLQVNLAQVEFK